MKSVNNSFVNIFQTMAKYTELDWIQAITMYYILSRCH